MQGWNVADAWEVVAARLIDRLAHVAALGHRELGGTLLDPVGQPIEQPAAHALSALDAFLRAFRARNRDFQHRLLHEPIRPCDGGRVKLACTQGPSIREGKASGGKRCDFVQWSADSAH